MSKMRKMTNMTKVNKMTKMSKMPQMTKMTKVMYPAQIFQAVISFADRNVRRHINFELLRSETPSALTVDGKRT